MGHRAAKVQFPFARRRYTYEAEARVVYVTLLGWACVLVTKSLSNLPDGKELRRLVISWTAGRTSEA